MKSLEWTGALRETRAVLALYIGKPMNRFNVYGVKAETTSFMQNFHLKREVAELHLSSPT